MKKKVVLDLMDISVLKGNVLLTVFLTVPSVFSNEVIQKKVFKFYTPKCLYYYNVFII